jgi:group I intron endonuclease
MDKARQAELKREYRERRQPAGVYRITNTATGRIFIGSSVDVNARINRHKAGFNFLDSHELPALMADVKAYGKENFTFDVVELLNGEYESDAAMKDDLALLERMWLETCQPFGDKGYNTPAR